MRHLRLLLSLCAVIALASGCAFGNRQVNLTYGPGAPAVALRPPVFGSVAVARLADARKPDEGTGVQLGKIRNGYGIVTAGVYANQDPVLWVTEGVARSLIAEGFTVRRLESPADGGNLVVIGGAVDRASCGNGMDAHVSALLNIQQRGTIVATVNCDGYASKTGWTVSADEFRTVFEAAMDDFAKSCGPKLTRILTEGAQ